jgi:hypothetical protein
MPEGPCEVFAFVTTMVVFATFLGPPIVAVVTYLQFRAQATGHAANTSKMRVALFLTMPWLLGLLVAFWTNGDGQAGSYRGLLCYNTAWDSFSTGGITVTVFALSAFVTIISYIATASVVRKALEQASKNETAKKAFMTILTRGVYMVLTFFLTWALFIVVAVVSMGGTPLPLTLEMLASLSLSVQPIIDTFLILNANSMSMCVDVRPHFIHAFCGWVCVSG